MGKTLFGIFGVTLEEKKNIQKILKKKYCIPSYQNRFHKNKDYPFHFFIFPNSYISKTLKNQLKLIYQDDVTQLFNQRKLFKDLDFLFKNKTSNSIFSVLFIDIDHFKHINDTYGHIFGSKTLVHIAKILKKCVNKVTDLVYRYGGDEFVVILPGFSLEKSSHKAHKILEYIKKNTQISVSIGVSTCPQDGTDAISILHFADQMMYQAKKNGRGIVFHTGLLPSTLGETHASTSSK